MASTLLTRLSVLSLISRGLSAALGTAGASCCPDEPSSLGPQDTQPLVCPHVLLLSQLVPISYVKLTSKYPRGRASASCLLSIII